MYNLTQLIHFADTQINVPNGSNTTQYSTGLPKVSASNGSGYANVQTVLSILFGVLGAVAVIIIIIASIQYITSQGDPQATSRLRNTIIYAAVGLAIAISAEVIVTFVLSNV